MPLALTTEPPDCSTVVVNQDPRIEISPETARWNARIEAALPELRALPQIEMPVRHHFAHGIYAREGTLIAENIYVGKAHRHQNITVFISGRASLVMDGKIQEIVAPCIVRSEPGVMKILYVRENLHGAVIHANPKNVTDPAVLDEEFVFPTDTFGGKEIESAMELLKLNEAKHG